MEWVSPRTMARSRLRPWPILTALAITAPLVSLAVILRTPAENVRLQDFAGQHFGVTTNVAMLADVIAFLLARSAMDRRDPRTLLVALGFVSMAGLFTVHGLTTPGVLFMGQVPEAAATLVSALSSQLSLLVPAVFFAASYAGPLRRLEGTHLAPRRLITVTVAGLLLYGAAAIALPELVARTMLFVMGQGGVDLVSAGQSSAFERYAPWIVATAAVAVALYVFAARRQAGEFARDRLPTQAALGVSYLLLAEAQIAMVPSSMHLAAFWEYHGLMAGATLLAIGAMFVELDRRRGLERFLPSMVVERVVAGDRLSLSGERRTATILFTDLRGSTALAERLSPEATIAVLNAYLRTMASAVMAEGGILDKFTGDGLMAIFGAMGDPTDGARAAARAAARIRADLAALNTERAARGEPVVGHGVGIHSGPVVLGAVGLPERSDYTAVGDTVNTAARMEGLTKRLGVDVVLSGETARLLDGVVPLRSCGEFEVSGKERPLPVFTLA
ncbi:MAG: adenylate/guanylate cyclase domain-containing protein [Candidatus Limnocylindria bacterium]